MTPISLTTTEQGEAPGSVAVPTETPTRSPRSNSTVLKLRLHEASFTAAIADDEGAAFKGGMRPVLAEAHGVNETRVVVTGLAEGSVVVVYSIDMQSEFEVEAEQAALLPINKFIVMHKMSESDLPVVREAAPSSVANMTASSTLSTGVAVEMCYYKSVENSKVAT